MAIRIDEKIVKALASDIVDEILSDLIDRPGFDNLWRGLDGEGCDEIERTWVDLVTSLLEENLL